MSFAAGNQEWRKRKRESPGRPKRSTEDKFVAILRSTVTPEDWSRIVQTAIARASAGDHQARQWLSDWLQGKVPDKIEHTGADGDPVTIIITKYADPGL